MYCVAPSASVGDLFPPGNAVFGDGNRSSLRPIRAGELRSHSAPIDVKLRETPAFLQFWCPNMLRFCSFRCCNAFKHKLWRQKSAVYLTLFTPQTGDKFGESQGGGQAPPSFWEVPGLPRKFPKLPRKFFGDFPGSSLAVELNSNPGVPRKFPRLPRKFPGLPRKLPGLPRGSALSLGNLTPSPDSQKLSLTKTN